MANLAGPFTLSILMISAAPAFAQQGNTVNDYLCQFADKCEPAAAASPSTEPPSTTAPRKPATRGFRLATAAPTPVATPSAQAMRTPARRSAGVVHNSSAAVRTAPGGQRHVNLMLRFDYNSDALTAVTQARCATLARALLTPDLLNRRFRIEGHTDARGSRAGNIDLSRRRAKSVVDFLIAQGVAADRIEARGVGSDDPLPGQPATAEANRRVEAVLL